MFPKINQVAQVYLNFVACNNALWKHSGMPILYNCRRSYRYILPEDLLYYLLDILDYGLYILYSILYILYYILYYNKKTRRSKS